MKTTHWIGIVLILLVSCKKENRWEKVEVDPAKVNLEFTDLSQEFFNQENSLESLQQKYPFFFDETTPSEVWDEQRADSVELAVFSSSQKAISKEKLKSELNSLFAYYQYYFPTDKIPHIFTYSSGLQNIDSPVIFGRREGMLFIAMDGFLGQDSDWYKMERVYPYIVKSMNPENLSSKIVEAIGRELVPFDPRQQTFVDMMIYEGKKLILADAFLPKTEDYLKIEYSPEDFEWAQSNEGEIWNFFVEQNMIFDTDKSNKERFIDPSPYSKFLNEIETDSPGRIGAWIGWRICKKYLDENPKVNLQEFLEMDPQIIFKESKYKPKKGNANYTPRREISKDEVDSSLE